MYDIIAAVGFFLKKSLINSSMINQNGIHVRKILLFLLFIAIQSVIEALRTNVS